jgi:hypothetical protein
MSKLKADGCFKSQISDQIERRWTIICTKIGSVFKIDMSCSVSYALEWLSSIIGVREQSLRIALQDLCPGMCLQSVRTAPRNWFSLRLSPSRTSGIGVSAVD